MFGFATSAPDPTVGRSNKTAAKRELKRGMASVGINVNEAGGRLRNSASSGHFAFRRLPCSRSRAGSKSGFGTGNCARTSIHQAASWRRISSAFAGFAGTRFVFVFGVVPEVVELKPRVLKKRDELEVATAFAGVRAWRRRDDSAGNAGIPTPSERSSLRRATPAPGCDNLPEREPGCPRVPAAYRNGRR